jgi:hypothetical protein
MIKSLARRVASLVKRILSAVSSIFACGTARLTPEQKAKLGMFSGGMGMMGGMRRGARCLPCGRKPLSFFPAYWIETVARRF